MRMECSFCEPVVITGKMLNKNKLIGNHLSDFVIHYIATQIKKELGFEYRLIFSLLYKNMTVSPNI